MLRRRSQSTPDARRTGPDWPSAIASSAERRPMPFVRLSQIAFRSRIASYSSIAFGIFWHHSRACGKKPSGMSSARPPAWK